MRRRKPYCPSNPSNSTTPAIPRVAGAPPAGSDQPGDHPAQGFEAKAHGDVEGDDPPPQVAGCTALQLHVGADVAQGDAEAQQRQRQQRHRQHTGQPQPDQGDRAQQRPGIGELTQARQCAADRQHQGRHEGTSARRPPQPTQHARITGKHRLGQDRQQRCVAGRQQVDRDHIDQQLAHIACLPHVRQPLTEHLGSRAAGLGAGATAHLQQAEQQCQEGYGRQCKTGRLTGQRDQCPGQWRANETCTVDQHGIEHQRVGQVGRVIDKTADQRLAQRGFQSVEQTQQQGHAGDHRAIDPTQPGGERQYRRLQCQHHLHDDQQSTFVMPVDPCTGQWADKQLRSQRKKGDQPQQHGRTCQVVGQPGQRHLLHPLAQRGNALAGEIDLEIAVGERPDGRGPLFTVRRR